MKRLSRILFCVFIASVFAPAASAKEWRGIVPLHSTRSDVARLFGTCDRDSGCKVRVGNEEAYFVFSNGTMGHTKCAKDLPPDTVFLIEVRLINPATSIMQTLFAEIPNERERLLEWVNLVADRLGNSPSTASGNRGP